MHLTSCQTPSSRSRLLVIESPYFTPNFVEQGRHISGPSWHHTTSRVRHIAPEIFIPNDVSHRETRLQKTRINVCHPLIPEFQELESYVSELHQS